LHRRGNSAGFANEFVLIRPRHVVQHLVQQMHQGSAANALGVVQQSAPLSTVGFPQTYSSSVGNNSEEGKRGERKPPTTHPSGFGPLILNAVLTGTAVTG
jgi:hypothetical protein